MGLFRKEALEHQNRRLYGEVTLATPLSNVAIAGLLLAILFGILAILMFAEYARKERVSGWLTPDKGLARIVSSDYGVVESVYVVAGDRINAGEPLMKISLDRGLESGGQAVADQLVDLDREESELQTQLRLAGERFADVRTELTARMENLFEEQRLLRVEREIQSERVGAAEDLYTTMQSAGAASGLEVRRQYEAVLTLRQAREQLAREYLVAEREIRQVRSNLEAVPNDEATALSELRRQLAELNRRRSSLERQGGMVLHAPFSGHVAALTARTGQSVRPDSLLSTILPEDGQLEAELFVPTRAAGFIDIGQEVQIRYDAFPYQSFGARSGFVRTISRTIFNPEELPRAIALDQPAYRITVSLDAQYVSAGKDQFPLQAGMTLQADIVQRRQRLWRLLFGSLGGA